MAVSEILENRDLNKSILKFTAIVSKDGIIVKNLLSLFMTKDQVISISQIGLKWLPCMTRCSK